MSTDVPPYQIQELIPSIFNDLPESVVQEIQVKCAQAQGTELYVGCSNGELMRFAIHSDDPKVESYTMLSRQSLPNDKPVEEIVLLPSISRALVFSDNQIHFYTLPSLDVVSYQVVKPIRHVIAFAVDQHHLSRAAPSPSGPPHRPESVDFCVLKRSALAMYSLRERLFYQKEIPLPQGGTLARRINSSLFFADRENYNMLNLETADMLPLIPFNQDYDNPDLPVEPFIVPTGEDDVLVVSWTGQGSMGIFLNMNGDPVRGTLQWAQHPISISLELPNVIAILPSGSIEIHNIETQNLVQVIPPPSEDAPVDKTRLISSLSGYAVPLAKGSSKMHKVPVKLKRGTVTQSDP